MPTADDPPHKSPHQAPYRDPVVPAGRLAAAGQPTLDGGPVTLRPWRRDDVEVVRAAFADPAIRFWNLEDPVDRAQALATLDQWVEGWRTEARASWAVADTATGEVLGRVTLRNILLRYGTAECAYWTLPAARGRGVAAAAARTASGWALRTVGLHRIDLRHSVRNPASCRVALRAGFAPEGTLRQALRHADGWHDMHWHGLLAEDLPAAGADVPASTPRH